jgi:NitT/TauT family transport system ATP-binding protein
MIHSTHTPKLRLRGVSKQFLATRATTPTLAVADFSLDLSPGEFVCIVGPSGCGKSTVLNMIAGLDTPSAGSIEMDGRAVTGPGADRGVMFQDYALMPWQTVEQNIGFGLAHARVALARLLANGPDILLLDEPLGALDAQTRLILQVELLRIWGETRTREQRKTAIFITHDIEEAVFLGDRVIVMSSHPGRVKADIAIDLPRPRNEHIRADPRFGELSERIWNLIRDEAYRAIGGGVVAQPPSTVIEETTA